MALEWKKKYHISLPFRDLTLLCDDYWEADTIVTDKMITDSYGNGEITPMGVYVSDGMYVHPAVLLADWGPYSYVGTAYSHIPEGYDDEESR